MFCKVSVHLPPYLLVFIINTGYLLSEHSKAIELGQSRAQTCAILRDGGKGMCCLRLSIVPSTTLHHRHCQTLYYCRVWNHPDSFPRTYDNGKIASPAEPEDALLWSLSWKHCRAAERHRKANHSQQNWTWPAGSAIVAKGPAVSARFSASVRRATTHLNAHLKKKNGVKQRQRKTTGAWGSAEPKITLPCITKSLAFF